MSFQKAEMERIEVTLEAFLQREQPPAHIRPQLDYAYVISGQSIELHEVRPRWDRPEQKMARPFAKATYARTAGLWRVYWRRADLKWHSYQPTPTVPTLDAFLSLVSLDEHACFHG